MKTEKWTLFHLNYLIFAFGQSEITDKLLSNDIQLKL